MALWPRPTSVYRFVGHFMLKVLQANVQMESFSMHGPVFKFLCTGGLDMLMRVGQEVIEQRDNEMPQLQYVCNHLEQPCHADDQ